MSIVNNHTRKQKRDIKSLHSRGFGKKSCNKCVHIKSILILIYNGSMGWTLRSCMTSSGNRIALAVSVETHIASCIFQHSGNGRCESRASRVKQPENVPVLRDVCAPGLPLSPPQLDGPLPGPVHGGHSTGVCGCGLDGEVAGATRLVHTQDVLL